MNATPFDPSRLTFQPYTRLPSWIVTALGVRSADTPSLLLYPMVQPTLEINQPVTTPFLIPTPAAGAGAIITVPAGQEWELIGGFFHLTTDATVINLRPRVRVSWLV